MNKQEIERALEWANAYLEYEKHTKATYEDTCGTGDMTEDERKEIYEAMDSHISLFATITEVLEHQLTNGWIPCSERLPEYGQHVILMLNNEEKVTQVVGYLKSSDDERFNNQFSVYDGCTMPDYLIKEYVKAWRPLPPEYKEVSE